MLYPPASPPPTKLGIYRQLSRNAGVHVSPLQLGAMSVGDKWNQYMGANNKENSFKLLDTYFDAGGNFIDTAHNYQEGASEEAIGEWAQKRGIRDQLFIATKYGTISREDSSIKQRVNYAGNSVKAMNLCLNTSLRRLRTSYIDLFYVHWWDYETSIEEIMRGLHALVLAGKVLYLGISDTPAWVVSKANQYARDHALTPFSVYQGKWSVLTRDFERDIIPMARSEGLALAPWQVLEGGKFRTDAEEEEKRKKGNYRTIGGPEWERTESEKKMSHALEKVAKEVGASQLAAVAIAYLLQKVPYVFPIIGGSNPDRFIANLEALDISLTDAQIQYLESVVSFNPGFPNDMMGDGTDTPYLAKIAANYEKPLVLHPSKPTKKE